MDDLTLAIVHLGIAERRVQRARQAAPPSLDSRLSVTAAAVSNALQEAERRREVE